MVRDLTRRLPLAFRGTLDGTQLVQFSLSADEARELLPAPLKPALFNDRALISCVNVQLRHLRPAPTPRALSGYGLGYRHVAFRMLVDDSELHADGLGRGIFFVRSFTERPLVATAAEWFTSYRLHRAELRLRGPELMVTEGGRVLAWRRVTSIPSLPPGPQFADWESARRVLALIDRAYAVDGKGRVRVTRIRRADWPLAPIGVSSFRQGFFETARFECAFAVSRPIDYLWEAPREVRLAS